MFVVSGVLKKIHLSKYLINFFFFFLFIMNERFFNEKRAVGNQITYLLFFDITF